MTQPKPQPPIEAPEAPAIVTPLHVLRRPATDKDMKPITGTLAWSKLTQIEAYFERGMLGGGNPKYTAESRKAAGMAYTALFDAWQPPSTDSSQALNISKSHGGGSANERRADAGRALACIHSHLRHSDRQIIMMVAGEGHTPAQAIRAVCGGDYRDAVPARLRESLDALCDAQEIFRLRRGFVNMERG